GQELRNAPVDVFPEFAPPRVEIQTAALGLSASDVESFITVPLEQSLAGLPSLDILRSNSVAQLSQIELLFKPDADLMHSRQLVQERIESITPTLPPWAAPRAVAHGRHPPPPPDWGRAAVHDAAGVGDQPCHEDRHVVEVDVRDGHV